MKKNECVHKKIIALAKGLSFSILFGVLCITTITAQAYIPSSVFDQQGGAEIIITDHRQVDNILHHDGVTIDHGCSHEAAKLYVTTKGYDYLIEQGVDFDYVKRLPSVIKMKSPEEILSFKGGACMPAMDFYPTYEGYLSMMTEFATNYPDLCEIISIGTLRSGRELLVAHIGDDLDSNDDEPNFLYTSTMHGDETAGFPMMLQLIDHLLCNYDNDERIKSLVDNINIFINPLANPDGTYTDDNSTVQGATRRNANFIDLNRNYPDPEDGPNPDNRQTQDETQFFIDFSDRYSIQLSCNIHGGAEVVNYPWDTWSQLHADDSWWIQTCRDYADACQANSSSDYMTDYEDGITNGYAWYEVDGGRQDHMTYFKRGREMTLEISGRKLLNSERLPEVWEANREAMLNYMQESLYGLRGIIKDCDTGEAIKAEVHIIGHDKDNSSVFSDSLKGTYFRYLDDGTYEVSYTAEGYDTIYRSITILDYQVHREDIELCPLNPSLVAEHMLRECQIYISDGWLHLCDKVLDDIDVRIYSVDGHSTEHELLHNKINVSQYPSGVYFVQFTSGLSQFTHPLLIP